MSDPTEKKLLKGEENIYQSASGSKPSRRVTTRRLIDMKKSGKKIVCLTAYDALMARVLDESGVDVLLVGDSLGNVVQGHETTIPVTLEDIIYHTKAVVRGAERALIVADMPFMSYQVSAEEAFRNAGRLMKEAGANVRAFTLDFGEASLEKAQAEISSLIGQWLK